MMVVKKQSKIYKEVCHKKNLNFENFENCLEATQLENKINYLEKKTRLT